MSFMTVMAAFCDSRLQSTGLFMCSVYWLSYFRETKSVCVCVSFHSVEHLSQELNPPEAFSSVSILTIRPEAFSSVSILTIRPDPCLISLYTSAHTEVNLNSFISVCVFVSQYVVTIQRSILLFLQLVYSPSTI